MHVIRNTHCGRLYFFSFCFLTISVISINDDCDILKRQILPFATATLTHPAPSYMCLIIHNDGKLKHNIFVTVRTVLSIEMQ